MNKKILFTLLLFFSAQHSQLLFGMNNSEDKPDNIPQNQQKDDKNKQNDDKDESQKKQKINFQDLIKQEPNLFHSALNATGQTTVVTIQAVLQSAGQGFGTALGETIFNKIFGKSEEKKIVVIGNEATTLSTIINNLKTLSQTNGTDIKITSDTRENEEDDKFLKELKKEKRKLFEDAQEARKCNREIMEKLKNMRNKG